MSPRKQEEFGKVVNEDVEPGKMPEEVGREAAAKRRKT
jgi:hypothetical protein